MKLFSDEILTLLQRLYDSMISLNYTPSVLRTSKVIMIPKPGKEDYTIAKSYRPISLTPFLFKLLVIIVIIYLRLEHIRKYTQGKSLPQKATRL